MLRARFAPALVFAGVFLLLLVLYWPAHEAGWVSDTLGWLDAVRTQSFSDFINRRGFGVRSFYQTTQIVTWSFYQLFGANRLAWHLLFVALQSLNAALLFAFLRGLLRDSGLSAAAQTALFAVLLFSLSPYLTEVIVWEAAFHYLQGLVFILLQLLLLQAYIRTGRGRPAIPAALLFAIASFSLELFYLTPVFSLLLLLYYRFGTPGADTHRIRQASHRFFLPQLALLAAHLLLVRLSLNASTGRLGDTLWAHPLTYFAIKPPDYTLHLLGGRFLPQAVRSAWHRFFCTIPGAGLFYAALTASLSYIVFRFRRMTASGQLISWAWCMTLAAMAIVTPMWFPERLLVMGDRYLYLMLPWFTLIISLLLGRLRLVLLRNGIQVIFLLGSGAGVSTLAGMWQRSELLTQKMQRALPAVAAGDTILLLNNPANFYGIPMTGAGSGGEFGLYRRLMYRANEPFAIREAFALEYRNNAAIPVVQADRTGSVIVRAPRPDQRWWFGPDYATAAAGAGWSAKLIAPDRYRLEIPQPTSMLIPLIWNGQEFQSLHQSQQ